MEEGTGIVHIAPGCGAEDFELARVHDLPVLTPVDEAGRFYDGYGWLHGTSTAEAKEQIIGDLGERGGRLDPRLLLEADGRLAAQHGRLEHLPQALLRPAASVLPLRVRARERR